MIPEKKIIEIRNKANIVDIVSSYIKVEKKGKNHFALCPFHDDHNPSLSISEEKQIFNCFTCNTGGNVFSFVMEYENVDFREAVKIVADKVGVKLDYVSSKSPTINTKDTKILDIATKYYHNNLFSAVGLAAKKYLHSRDITDEAIKTFELGYADDKTDELYTFLKKQNYSLDELYSLGLVEKQNVDVYDFFKNRIIIPIKNPEGVSVGFSGRVFNDEKIAKYINTKETPLFKKGNLLFNYHEAKNHTKREKTMIIVEGNFDVIKLYSKGIKNVIATMGTALTTNQAYAIKKLRTPVKLLFDSDEAGINAAIVAGDILLEHNVKTTVVELGEKLDPDDYVSKYGVEKFQNKLNQDTSFVDFKISKLKEKYDLKNTEELSSFIKDIIPTIFKLDELTKNLAIDKISKEYSIDKKILLQEFEKETPHEKTPPELKPKPTPENTTRYAKIANIILYYLLSDYNFSRIYKGDLNFFEKKEERELFAALYAFQKKSKDYAIADFLVFIQEDKVLYEKTIYILNEYVDEELDNEKFLKYIEAMRKHLNDELIKDLTEKIKDETDSDKKVKLMEKLAEVKKEG